MAGKTNPYCARVGIEVPSLAAVRPRPDASTYSLLIVALLQRGRPMTLAEVADDFVAAGIVERRDDAVLSLSRCRPGRPPVYRDGDHYSLDLYDDELDLWIFRLGLRPPRSARPAPPAPPAAPPARPPSTEPLTVEELDRAWSNDANLMHWSAQRTTLAVLDAHRQPMTPDAVVAFVTARTKWHRLRRDQPSFRRRNSMVIVDDSGMWTAVTGASEIVMARDAVRDLAERVVRYPRSTPEQIAESTRAYERRRTAHADELARLRRVIVHAFPVASPRAVVLVDVERRELTTLIDDQVASIRDRLRSYDELCGIDIRGTLRALGVAGDDLRLGELGPPQKSLTLSSGRTMKITTAMLIEGSCGIRRPLADPDKLHAHLAKGRLAQLRERLERDAKAIFALHQYGKTHGGVRLLDGSIDEMFPAPWCHRDEPTLHHLLREAHGLSMGILAVVGTAPAFGDPWSRAWRLNVHRGRSDYEMVLRTEHGQYIDDRDVQLAKLEAEIH